MKELIFVTGATGTVGSELVKQLSAKNKSVRAAIHSNKNIEWLKNLNVETVQFNLYDESTYSEALKNVDKVFFVGFANPDFAELSRKFALAAKENGVKQIVKLSAYGADFAPEFLIAKYHRESEQAIESTGIGFTHLRPNVFMQNLNNYYGEMIKHQNKIFLAHGKGEVSFIDIRDVAAAAVEIFSNEDHLGKSYTLTGNEVFDYYESAEILSEAVGKEISYVEIPLSEAKNQMEKIYNNNLLVDIGISMAEFSAKGGFSKITNTLEELIGRKPISLKQYAKDYAEFFK